MRRAVVLPAVALATAAMQFAAPATHAASTHVVTVYADHFVPAEVAVGRGDSVQFFDPDPWGNGEAPGHSLTERGPGRPRFDSGVVGLGRAAEVAGVAALPPGSYRFTCRIHPFMSGTLIVR